MRSIKLTHFTFFLFLIISCKTEKNEQVDRDTIDYHTSQNSLDWEGAYKGILPCADCEGIETVLELHKNNTYLLQTRYLGVGDEKQIEEHGSFSWDEHGQNIKLNDKEATNQYKIGENVIWHLNINGELISGELSAFYILRKH